MKVIVELPDPVLGGAKAAAVKKGKSLTDFLTQAVSPACASKSSVETAPGKRLLAACGHCITKTGASSA